MSTESTLTPLVALVLDDSASNRHVMSTILERSGFSVLTAETGTEALEIIRHHAPDLAVLDVNLADMTGFEVCEAIRAHPPTEAIPVIHISATAVDPEDRSEGLMRGADAYLIGPVEPRELLAVITALLRRTGLRERTLRTVSRLRSLNSATADVHAASADRRVFEALVLGASVIADDEALVITPLANRALVWHGVNANVTSRSVDLIAAKRALAPALAGFRTIDTDDPELVDEPHTGVCFIDETGDPAGAIFVKQSRTAGDDELLPLLAQLALTASLALANLRALDIEHRIALFLQRNLLPQEPPSIDGLTMAFRYIAASQQAQVGGDFYEAFVLDSGQAVVAIGDVVGHSLRAATVMGEIRQAMRAYALDGHDCAGVLKRVEGLLRTFHPHMYTSAVFGMLDSAQRRFTFCNAGHLPVLVVRSGGAEFIPSTGSLLGLGRTSPEEITVDLAEGDRIVMVTDGLVERRDEVIDVGLERLRLAAERFHHRPLPEMIDELVATVAPEAPASDDIAIVAFSV